jgi:hypothetical protein
MKFLPTLFLMYFVCSCKNEKTFDYETSIASKVFIAEIKRLDNTIGNYSTNRNNNYLDDLNTKADDFIDSCKNAFRKNPKLNLVRLQEKMKKFDTIFSKNLGSDKTFLQDLILLGTNTVSDLDQLRLHIKSNLVAMAYANKIQSYTGYSAIALAPAVIKNGDEFEVLLSQIAWNTREPDQWYLMKGDADTLTKESVLDTLKQNEYGAYTYKTRKYQRGENELVFFTKSTAAYDVTLKRTITFFVK